MASAPSSLGRRLARFVQRRRRGAAGSKSRLAVHGITFAAVSALLALINLLTSPGFPWFLFPVAGWGFGLLRHAIHARAARARGDRLQPEAAAVEAAATDVPAADAPLLARAAELRTAILAELQAGGEEAARWRSELAPELETYTAHLSSLLQARRDLERATARVSAADITQELAALRGKLEATDSAELKNEYRQAAAQYQGQLKSLQEVQERIETIDLRAKSAVLALQQLALDLPRLRAAPAEEPPALASLRDKAQDLTHYLDDLRASRAELEGARTGAPHR